MAVSYTHLDVYKRQMWVRSRRARASSTPAHCPSTHSGSSKGDTFTSVSYTHLDVYKRQAMSLSSFCVVSNALRLNLFDPHSARKDHKLKFAKERKTMEKTLKIEGMMCTHCSCLLYTSRCV